MVTGFLSAEIRRAPSNNLSKAAMADKPSRALVLYGDGLARFILPSHSNLNSFASKACCGFLTLPNSPSSEREDERIVREFAVLLDACETSLNTDGLTVGMKNPNEQTLSSRFMGMKAALVTNNSTIKSFGVKLGFDVFQLDELAKGKHLDSQTEVDTVAIELLSLLGFQDDRVVDASRFDLVLLHVGAGENLDSKDQKFLAAETEYINTLVGCLTRSASPGSETGSRLHLSLVMSYGRVFGDADNEFFISKNIYDRDSKFSRIFPRQSYTMKGEVPREDVRHHCPMLIAQWQDAVTRKDMVEKFAFEDFKENGANLAIPADRFLHEVAFKLWKAPKYGA